MTNDNWIAGRYQLESIMLKKYSDREKILSLKPYITGFNIFETMDSSAIRGQVTVFDSKNMFKEFDIKCEEYIEIKYSDWWNHQRIEEYFVYAITDVKYPVDDRNNAAFVQYTLHFVSIPKVFTADTSIRQAYKNKTIKEYVEELYKDTYEKQLKDKQLRAKRIYVQPTTGVQDFVIPNYTPEQTMNFFARRAYQSSSKNNHFRFFENRNAYYFCDPDYIETFTAGIDAATEIPKYYYNVKPDTSPEGQKRVMRTIMNVDFGNDVNIIEDINAGAYRRQIVEIDLVYGVIVPKPTYDHKQKFEADYPNKELPISNDFLNERMNKEKPRQTFFIKDYASPGAPQGDHVPKDRFFAELGQAKRANAYHYADNVIQITIHGDNSLYAGGMIELEFDERHEPNGKMPNIDKSRSGKYYIEAIDHIFFNNMYTQKCTLSRWGVDK